MRAIAKGFVPLTFLLLVLVPVVFYGNIDPWDQPIQGTQEPFPKKLTSKTFRTIGRWFNDRVGLRYPLTVIGEDWRKKIWQLRAHGHVLFGQDSWLFYTDTEGYPAWRMPDARGDLRIADEDIRKFDQQMTAVKAQLAACQKSAFIVIAPNKQSIYSDRLLEPIAPVRTRLDDFLEKLGPATRSMIIDPRRALNSAKAHFPVPVYYKTDTHWNQLGAFIAYQTVVEKLQSMRIIGRPELASLDRFEIHAAPFPGGDLAVRMLASPWRYPDDQVHLRARQEEPAVSLTEGPDRKVLVNPRGTGRVLMQGDSFAPPVAALLARHFAQVDLLLKPSWPPVVDGELITAYSADVTLIEIVERGLPELLAAPRNIARACEGEGKDLR